METDGGEALAGYDLDGTLTSNRPPRPKPFHLQTAEEREEYDCIRREHYRNGPLLRVPRESCWVVISGRPERYRAETEAWLEANGLKPCGVYLLQGPVTRRRQTEHKLSACKEAGVTHFYEDDPQIARALSRRGIPVVLVGRRTACQKGTK